MKILPIKALASATLLPPVSKVSMVVDEFLQVRRCIDLTRVKEFSLASAFATSTQERFSADSDFRLPIAFSMKNNVSVGSFHRNSSVSMKLSRDEQRKTNSFMSKETSPSDQTIRWLMRSETWLKHRSIDHLPGRKDHFSKVRSEDIRRLPGRSHWSQGEDRQRDGLD